MNQDNAARLGALPHPDWDEFAATCGRIELGNGMTVVPTTPLIGADIHGLNLTAPLGETDLDALSMALLRYKVVMIRSRGDWKMTVDEHTRFCQQLSGHWGIGPDTKQKQMNHSAGLTTHPFLPWQRGYPHIWPTGSVTGGGMQFKIRATEDVENYEPFAARKRAKKVRKTTKPGTFGAFAGAKDSVFNGANGFHFDDGFFHQPPSAVVLNAIVLPKVGGDTIFADTGAAYRALTDDVRERANALTQTMDWRHAFPLWEEVAAFDDAIAERVERLKRDYPPSTQPLIRQHPVTGELAIYANRGFTRHIDDVEPEESNELVSTLCRIAERPEYQVRLRWHDEGDVCIYDNRITNHYAVADYGNVGPRSLHHVALLGEPTRDPSGKVIG